MRVCAQILLFLGVYVGVCVGGVCAMNKRREEISEYKEMYS